VSAVHPNQGFGWLPPCRRTPCIGRVFVFSRNGHDFTERFATIAQELRELPAKTAVLDGEIVASDVDGRQVALVARV
jgi:ATP dependent DNA ligase domain